MKKGALGPKPSDQGKEQLLSSEMIYEGRLFRVSEDKLIEPSGLESERELVRHNGSVVILALDPSKARRIPGL